MTEHEQPEQEPEYWHLDEAIGEVRLWRGTHYTLRLMAHQSEEVYRQGRNEEIVPLRQQQGVRSNIQAKPYILLPDLTLDVNVSGPAVEGGPIGEVAASTWEGMRSQWLGQAAAWYYHEDRILVLWECFLEPRYRYEHLVEDQNSYTLWEGFERFLLARFPLATQVVTTHDDPEYETAAYQEFLTRMGYRQLSVQAFGKDVAPAP